jgi:ActR/RegA family two-component response regulator
MINALVVEDDPEFAEMLGGRLDQAGMIVIYCRTAAEASATLAAKQFNYVLIDLMLPPSYSQEGISVLREVLRRQHSVSTLLMTQRDQGTVSLVSEAMEIGARYFFDKNDTLVLDNIMAKIEEIEVEKRNGIFISHGHNELLKLKLKDFVEHRLKRRPVILAEQPSAGMTVVEKLERTSNECSSAIILMSADDMLRDGGARARQNVVHELGFFQGKYGRDKVILLVEDGVELFSNISGIVYIRFDSMNFHAAFESLRLEIES